MKRFFSEILSIVISIVIALGIFWVTKTYFFYQIEVDGDSMYPTMQDGERYILNVQGDIDRFDIVVFPAPDGSNAQYVKRVIGVPGDEIEYRDNQLYVNGQAVEEEYLNALEAANPGQKVTPDFTLDEITGEHTVPEGEYFVLGDNRPVSKDGRYFGFIDEETIDGTTNLRIWPFSKFGRIQSEN
ncbi:signal peptidase I [Aerococcus kribbianus]|uniref:Signal peptidase I n=1 Tax=Aerococcus kribbianus TaxID=2999064 RepID=A0A9X3FR34_9LACT|nr:MULTISPECIES: signal peptidase I [unclassified Aerococcus]MCZ0716792.1 signal peptidase I [Aerococcus sp. YH-aer221]MCZ0725080.1 signal peptidase I [Aerococcus sp. YH-aer222]